MADKKLEILIQTKADVSGAKEAGKAIEDVSKRASTAQPEAAKTPIKTGWLDALKGKLQEVIRLVPGLESVVGVFGKLASGPIGIATAAVTALASAFKLVTSAVREFMEAEVQTAKLDAALAQAGQLTEEYRARLESLASTLQKTTGVADEQWLGVLRKLTQFGADPSTISQYADAVKNLAGLLGGDVQTAASVFARAMQGNFEMFGRYGIVVSEAGSQTEKLEQVMRELASRGAGQLEAQNKTLSGSFRTLRNSTSDLLEAIGGQISNSRVLQSILLALANAAEWFAEKIKPASKALEGLENASRRTVHSLDDAKQATADVAGEMDHATSAIDATTKSYDRQVEAARRLARQQAEMVDAKLALELARIDEQEKGGRITPQAATTQRSQARIRAEENKTRIAIEQLNFEIKQREAQKDANARRMEEVQAVAFEREEAVPRKDEIDKRRSVLDQRLSARVEGLRAEAARLKASPWEFSSTEFGVTAGPRGLQEEGQIAIRIQHAIDAARAERETALKAFEDEFGDQTIDRLAGQAKEAREKANVLLQELYRANNALIEEIDALNAQREHLPAISGIKVQTEQTNLRAQNAEAQKRLDEKARQEAEQKRKEQAALALRLAQAEAEGKPVTVIPGPAPVAAAPAAPGLPMAPAASAVFPPRSVETEATGEIAQILRSAAPTASSGTVMEAVKQLVETITAGQETQRNVIAHTATTLELSYDQIFALVARVEALENKVRQQTRSGGIQ